LGFVIPVTEMDYRDRGSRQCY